MIALPIFFSLCLLATLCTACRLRQIGVMTPIVALGHDAAEEAIALLGALVALTALDLLMGAMWIGGIL